MLANKRRRRNKRALININHDKLGIAKKPEGSGNRRKRGVRSGGMKNVISNASDSLSVNNPAHLRRATISRINNICRGNVKSSRLGGVVAGDMAAKNRLYEWQPLK